MVPRGGLLSHSRTSQVSMITPSPTSSLPTPTPPESSRVFQILLHPQDSQVRACLAARPVHSGPQRSSWSRVARCEEARVRLPRVWTPDTRGVAFGSRTWAPKQCGARSQGSESMDPGRNSFSPGAQIVGRNFVLPAAWHARQMSCFPKCCEQETL